VNNIMPIPNPNETPTSYADRLGMWYSATVSLEHKKAYGQYLTPRSIATYMAGFLRIEQDEVWLLDPGAGSGVLACSAAEHLAAQDVSPSRLHVEAYETDQALARVLSTSLAYLGEWLSSRAISLEAAVRTADFVMTYSQALSDVLGENPSLFTADTNPRCFDIVVSNPPYFKVPKSDPRAKSTGTVIHGQPNIYALFMAVAASALKPSGQFVFITPRSYTSGPYFRLFRERFFAKMRPEAVHVFESRTDAFKRDDILQENIILKARREDGWTRISKNAFIRISSSNGSGDFLECRSHEVRSELILDLSSFDKVLHVPTSDEELAVMETVRSWSGSLQKMGLEISTGPVVPFRAVPLLDEEGEVPRSHAPLLWMQHVKAMKVRWPISLKRKPQFIKVTRSAMKLLVPNRNYVLIRRFSAKEENRRLVAAPYLSRELDSPWLGLENHLNYIHRPGGDLTEEEACGLSALYNCSMLDTYFRTLNGSTQVSATELRAMPLPEKQQIVTLGEIAKDLSDRLDELDALVTAVFSPRTAASTGRLFLAAHETLVESVREAATSG